MKRLLALIEMNRKRKKEHKERVFDVSQTLLEAREKKYEQTLYTKTVLLVSGEMKIISKPR